MEKIKTQTVMFSGGGTGGSVTPLLAIFSELIKERPDINLIFVGAKVGPEKELISNFKEREIKFLTIPSGKWRRYLSLRNLLDIFKIGAAFYKSLLILRKEKPCLVVSAGSFVSVPLIWAAACYRIPILIHQQDIRAGLANKLMAPFAQAITVTFEKSLTDYGPRAVLTGNPLRDISALIANSVAARKRYGFRVDFPLIMVIGGGTGATALNNLIGEALPSLLEYCQVVHLTGYGKKPQIISNNGNYQAFEFLDQNEILSLMVASDLVVSRCGLGVLTELAALEKPVILIPIPNSHQEDNANLFASRNAALVLSQVELKAEKLASEIKSLLNDSKLCGTLSHNISKIMKPRAAQSIAAIIWEMIKIK